MKFTLAPFAFLFVCCGAAAQNYTYIDSVYYGATYPYGEVSTNLEIVDSNYYLGGARSMEDDEWLGVIPGLRKVDAAGNTIDYVNVPIDSAFTYINLCESFIKFNNNQWMWTTMGDYFDPITNSAQIVFGTFDSGIVSIAELTQGTDTTSEDAHVGIRLSDDHFLVAGKKTFYDEEWNADYELIYLIKLDQNGDVEWEKFINPFEDSFYRTLKILELSDGSIVLCLAAYSPFKPALIRITADGDSIIWAHKWGSQPEFDDWYPHAVLADNGNVVVAYCYTTWVGTGQAYESEVRLREYDPFNEEIVWDTLLAEAKPQCFINDLVNTPDGGYAILGTNAFLEPGEEEGLGYKSFIIKCDAVGTIDWMKYYHHFLLFAEEYGLASMNQLEDLEITPDGGFAAAGYAIEDYNGLVGSFLQQSWLIKMDMCGDVEWVDCPVMVEEYGESSVQGFNIYPNPATLSFTIESSEVIHQVFLKDISGRTIFQRKENAMHITLDVSQLSPGLYLLEADFGNGKVSAQKVVVE